MSFPYYIILQICEFFSKCCPTPRSSVFSRSRYCSDNSSDNSSYNRPTNYGNNHEYNNRENNRENNIVYNEPKISTFNDNKKESISFRRNNISPENPFEFEIIDDLPSNTS